MYTGNEIYASLEYVMEPKSAAESGGEGLCVYLCDPSVLSLAPPVEANTVIMWFAVSDSRMVRTALTGPAVNHSGTASEEMCQ